MNVNPYNAQNSKLTTAGGQSSALNLAAGANLVKAGQGRVNTLIVNAAGTAGTFAVYDSATTGGASASNAIYVGLNTTAAATVIKLDFPYSNGLVVTVPTGGAVAVSYI